MIIKHTVTGCIAVYNYTSSLNLLSYSLVSLLVFFPLFRVIFSFLKTFIKIKKIQLSCSQALPSKLSSIISNFGLSKDLFLVSCSEDLVAVSVGFFRKRIILSKGLVTSLSQKELESVVLHELYHTRFNHSSLLFLAELLANTLFFLPFLKDLKLLLKSELEKSADQYAVMVQQTSKYIKSSLRKVIVQNNQYSFFPKFSYKAIEYRINGLNKVKTKPSFSLRRLLLSLTVLLVFLSLFCFNKKYAQATGEDSANCYTFECVKECVSGEMVYKPISCRSRY